jgi:hypothetical protein
MDLYSLLLNAEAVNTWCSHWISEGFDAYEALMAVEKKLGRFNVDMNHWPLISAVDKACGDGGVQKGCTNGTAGRLTSTHRACATPIAHGVGSYNFRFTR